ncbi:MAG: Protease 3 [Chlamydiia bacterium]|nr:Protease 3 [Chlamydiia bacterium]
MKKIGFVLFFLGLTTLGITLPSNQKYEMIEEQSGLVIKTPALQNRKTAKLRLNNGLEAYLISDPDTDKSAAALAVHVGSWDDPHEYPGTAHFCEHMLFMGSKKYPDENEIFRYVFDHGGNLNAYTAPDRTVYMFSINNEAFEQGLDRFARFFIDPLFNPSGIGRELNAVDQEHMKNIEHDGWREWMIFKELGNPNHPNALFSTGNAETLGHIPRDTLVNWYEKNYNADEMHLVICSKKSIQELTQLVVTSFSDIPKRPHQAPDYTHMMSEHQLGHMLYIQPIREYRKLSFSWELPRHLVHDSDSHSADLVAYTLANKSENSLFEYLKQKSLVEDVDIEVERVGSDALLVKLEFDLTKEGLDQVDTIVEATFSNIHLIQNEGVPPHIFQELKTMQEHKYSFQSRKETFNFVSSTAHILVDEKLETFPRKSLIPTSYDKKKIDEIVSYLTPHRCLYTVIAPSALTGIEMKKKEKWLGGEYALVKVSDDKLKKWARASHISEIGLPYPNPFVPSSLSLPQTSEVEDLVPTAVVNESKGRIYHAGDKRYFVPEGVIQLNFKSPFIDGTPRSTALINLFSLSLNKALSPTFSQAARGGLYASTSQSNLGLKLNISGYTAKNELLLRAMIDYFAKPKLDIKDFELAKEELLSDYDNRSKALPFFRARELMGSMLYNTKPTSDELVQALSSITFAEFKEFADHLFEFCFVEGMVTGDVSSEATTAMWSMVKERLRFSNFQSDQAPQKRILVLPDVSGPFIVQHHSPSQGNVALLMVQCGDFTFEKHASQQILGKVLQEAFFSTLRTKQQTGYIAKSWEQESEKQLLFFFGVQSSSHQPEELLARYELFLEEFMREFDENIPEKRFENVKQMLITSLKMPPPNLLDKSSELNALAFEHQGDFAYDQKQIIALEKLDFATFKAQATEFLSRHNKRRLALEIFGRPSSPSDFKYEVLSSDRVIQMGNYVSSAEIASEDLSD